MNLYETIIFILKTHADGRFDHEGICNLLTVAGVTMAADLVRDIMAKLPPRDPTVDDFTLVCDKQRVLKAFRTIIHDASIGLSAENTVADLRNRDYDWTLDFVARIRAARAEWVQLGNDKSWTG